MTQGKVTINVKTERPDPQRPWFDSRFITLIEALFQLDTVEHTADFLRGLLSDYELWAVLQRWHIILYLYKTRLTYREIAEKLGCSTTTVNSIARWFKAAENPIRVALTRISPNELTEEELDEKETLEAHKSFLGTLKGGSFWAGFLGEYERTRKHPYIEDLVKD